MSMAGESAGEWRWLATALGVHPPKSVVQDREALEWRAVMVTLDSVMAVFSFTPSQVFSKTL